MYNYKATKWPPPITSFSVQNRIVWKATKAPITMLTQIEAADPDKGYEQDFNAAQLWL